MGEVGSASKGDDETAPYGVLQNKNGLSRHAVATTNASVAAAGLSGMLNAQKLQPIYYQQAKRLKALRSFQNISIDKGSDNHYIQNKQRKRHLFSSSNQQPEMQSPALVAERRKTHQPEKSGVDTSPSTVPGGKMSIYQSPLESENKQRKTKKKRQLGIEERKEEDTLRMEDPEKDGDMMPMHVVV